MGATISLDNMEMFSTSVLDACVDTLLARQIIEFTAPIRTESHLHVLVSCSSKTIGIWEHFFT